MRPNRRALGLALILCAALPLPGCGGGEGDETTTFTIPPGADQSVPGGDGSGVVEQAGGSGPAMEAEATAERYIEAIDDRDAAAVCALLAPGALVGVRGTSGPCVPALAAAIGRPATGGAPVWKSTRIEHPSKVVINAKNARITLEVFHRFSDRPNPSIEDDVIYLERRGDRWLVTKASATLYRAVGYPEPPLEAFTPPKQ
jgi:hypothetical protein